LRAGNCTPSRYLPTWEGKRFLKKSTVYRLLLIVDWRGDVTARRDTSTSALRYSPKFKRLREMPLDGAQDLLSMTNGLSIRLKCHRRVAAFDGHYKLKEVAVADHNVVQPTTIDLASPTDQR
jgi:hypothetical protein